MFQSTYLYKVRQFYRNELFYLNGFQSTYLYKVRLKLITLLLSLSSFNPRTYIRYDPFESINSNVKVVSIHVPI